MSVIGGIVVIVIGIILYWLSSRVPTGVNDLIRIVGVIVIIIGVVIILVTFLGYVIL